MGEPGALSRLQRQKHFAKSDGQGIGSRAYAIIEKLDYNHPYMSSTLHKYVAKASEQCILWDSELNDVLFELKLKTTVECRGWFYKKGKFNKAMKKRYGLLIGPNLHYFTGIHD